MLLHRDKGRFLDLHEDLEIFCHQKLVGSKLLNDHVTMIKYNHLGII